MQNLSLLPGFLTNSIDATAADKLSLIKFFSRYLLMYFFITLISYSDNSL